MGSARPPLPAGVDAPSFWDDLDWALSLHGRGITDSLAHELAAGLESVASKMKRLVDAPPARQLELAANVATAVRELQGALREYDEFRRPAGLDDETPDRPVLEGLLQQLLEEAECGLRAYLLDEGLVWHEAARSGHPIDSPLALAALGTIDALDRHGIPRAISNDGVTACVLRVMLRAVDQMRGQPPKTRKHLKEQIGGWYVTVDRLRSEEQSTPA